MIKLAADAWKAHNSFLTQKALGKQEKVMGIGNKNNLKTYLRNKWIEINDNFKQPKLRLKTIEELKEDGAEITLNEFEAMIYLKGSTVALTMYVQALLNKDLVVHEEQWDSCFIVEDKQ